MVQLIVPCDLVVELLFPAGNEKFDIVHRETNQGNVRKPLRHLTLPLGDRTAFRFDGCSFNAQPQAQGIFQTGASRRLRLGVKRGIQKRYDLLAEESGFQDRRGPSPAATASDPPASGRIKPGRITELVSHCFVMWRSSLPMSLSIAFLLLTTSTLLAQAPDQPPWGEPVDGLQYRLRAQRRTWQSWERPIVVLDVRNVSPDTITQDQLAERLLLRERGPMLLQKRLENFSQSRPYDLGLDVQYDSSKLTELRPNQSISIPITIVGVAQSAAAGNEKGLRPDELEVAFGKMIAGNKAVYYTAFVPVQILVEGTETDEDLGKFLNAYQIDGQSIEAGFVPAGPSLVDGEDLTLTFVVRNRSEQPYTFSFGGDYRGVNRHNRFKIEVRDERGNLLQDPGSEIGDFGGILYPRVVLAGRTTIETLDLAKYRNIPGPGKYSIKASFELLDEFNWGLQAGKRSSQLVESEQTLSILPRTDDNVATVVNRLLRRCQQTSGLPQQQIVATISKFGRAAAVPGLADLAAHRANFRSAGSDRRTRRD